MSTLFFPYKHFTHLSIGFPVVIIGIYLVEPTILTLKENQKLLSR